MPIKGLTDRVARLPRVGIIRKGAPKPERGPGRDQRHFRLQTEDPDLALAWTSAFGDEPTSIDVYLAYDDPDESFETCREEWVAGGLKHRCDGEWASIWLQPDGKQYRTDPIICPYRDVVYEDPKKRPCQPIGKLRVLVPAMRRIGVFELQTHSVHDIVSLTSNIGLYAMLARQAGRSLTAIPCTLSRREREVSTPGDGKRQRRVISLVHLDISPKWAAIQFARLDHDLTQLSANTPLQLPPGTPEELIDPDDEQAPLMPRPAVIDSRPVQQPSVTAPVERAQPTTYGPTFATPAQVRAIYAIGRDRHNLSEKEVDEQILAMFGVDAGHITRKQASDYITTLNGTEASGKQATPPVTKTPDTAPAPKAHPAVQIWHDLSHQIPEQGLVAYFIPDELPTNWSDEEVREGGKAFRAFVEGWKKMAKPAELTAIAEVIVAIRKGHGEEQVEEELQADAIPF